MFLSLFILRFLRAVCKDECKLLQRGSVLFDRLYLTLVGTVLTSIKERVNEGMRKILICNESIVPTKFYLQCGRKCWAEFENFRPSHFLLALHL